MKQKKRRIKGPEELSKRDLIKEYKNYLHAGDYNMANFYRKLIEEKYFKKR